MIGVMDPQNESITKKFFLDGLGQMEARMDAKFDVKLGILEARSDNKFSALETQMDDKFSVLEVRMDGKIDTLALSTQQEFAAVQQEFVAVRKEMAEGFTSVRNEIGSKIWESESRILRAIGDIGAVVNNHESRLLILERIVKP